MEQNRVRKEAYSSLSGSETSDFESSDIQFCDVYTVYGPFAKYQLSDGWPL
jgi:hypothetical protein